MKLEVAIILLFGISFSLYMGGYTSMFMEFVTKATTDPITIFQSEMFYAAVGFTAIGVIIAGLLGGGQAVIYMIPLAFAVFFFTNYFVFPLSFVYELGFSEELRYFFIGLFNIILLLAIISFIIGRE